jgi:hypothetical protein
MGRCYHLLGVLGVKVVLAPVFGKCEVGPSRERRNSRKTECSMFAVRSADLQGKIYQHTLLSANQIRR